MPSVRTCVGCLRALSLERGVRLRAPAGVLLVGAGDGRGAWICADSVACFDRAVGAKRLQRALRAEVELESITKVRASLIEARSAK
ncbi:MAG: DUF448 domain-containing protein [Ferrimicrobium sp.]